MSDLVRLDLFVEEENVDAVTGILVRLISYGWEEESLPSGETCFRVHCDNAQVREGLEAELCARAPFARVERTEVPRQDWTAAWREFFTPIKAGTFLVLPPWLKDKTPSEGRKVIVIEPKSAFGTGHHNTTTLCLEAIAMLVEADPIEGQLKGQAENPAKNQTEGQNTKAWTAKPLRPGMRFFDIGTGTGILGIACALSGLSGLGSDIDPVAVENAGENTVINRVEQAFAILPGSVEAAENESFDLVLANILAAPLKELAPAIMARLKPGGRLVLSGLLDVQADAVEAAYAPLGPARRLLSGDWVALVWGLDGEESATLKTKF